ncbi:MAG: hypothetical protein Q7U38_17850 [Methylobacter sp.]|nr:hypothetical protein [Methylobacter sp.]MDP2099123.1 hypothetical protein [Methylobacter sp.]MDP2429949.1 hypothetical protein [Methylobacter sp.]MDP3054794.1 hypothetical protein [Methylobacter sp.]MDP3361222.1 hypothetical protein [Methylobacter sp.]
MNVDTIIRDIDREDKIHELQRCLSVVVDLMEPATDLHAVNRADLALLLGYLSGKLGEAMQEGTKWI